MIKTFKEIINYREMIVNLVKKDLRGRYKGSVFGFLWTFINPLFQLLIYTFAFTYILDSDIDQYYLWLFVALIPWIFFSSSILGGSTSIRASKDLVTKIYFPREVLPIAYVTSCFINMLLTFIIIFITVLVSGRGIHLSVVVLPIIWIIEYILALGMAMLFSAITVYFRDMEHIMGIILQGWIYLTPVIFPIPEKKPAAKAIMMLNPMSPIILAYRDILYDGVFPSAERLLYSLGFAVIFFFIGFYAFGRLKRHFAEEL